MTNHQVVNGTAVVVVTAAELSDLLEADEDVFSAGYDSTVWEDEEYLGHYDYAKRWTEVRERAVTLKRSVDGR